jgi:hypothetical protein
MVVAHLRFLPSGHNGDGSELPLVSREHRHEPIQALRDATYTEHRIIWRGRYMCYVYWYVQCKAYTTSRTPRQKSNYTWRGHNSSTTMATPDSSSSSADVVANHDQACTLRPACGGARVVAHQQQGCAILVCSLVCGAAGAHPWQWRLQETS